LDSQFRMMEWEKKEARLLRRKRLAASQKEAVPSGANCQSEEQRKPETTPNDEQKA